MIRRLGQALITLFLVLLIVFFLVRLRGDPLQILVAGEHSLLTVEQIEELRHLHGFDKPIGTQFLIFFSNAVRGDFGTSFSNGLPALRLVTRRLPKTVELAFVSMFLAIILGMPLGVASALHRNSGFDILITSTSTMGIGMPPFWVAIMLILVFSTFFRVLPAYGAGSWRHFIMPSLALALPNAAAIARLARSMLLEELGKDFVQTARSKGLNEQLVIYKHALRCAMLPIVTQLGMQLGWLLGGSIIVESVFGWPGLGRLMVDSIGLRDLQVIQAGLLFFSTLFLLINLLVDLSYAWLDPRIRYG